MNFFESATLGIVQGITEFLPISSTGHLWVFEKLVFNIEPSIALEAFFHMATLLAVILFYRKKIWSLFSSVICIEKNKTEQTTAFKLLTATAITGIIGIATKDILSDIITLEVIASTLIITGILVLLSEYFSPQRKQEFSWSIAVFLGFVQAIAILPGISRSGITIVALLLLGIQKRKAIEISFLLSIPTILGAFLLMLPEISAYPSHIEILAFGAFIAFISAYFTISIMTQYIEKIWKYFAIWCFAVAGILFLC